jgi:hypothetical protein
MLDTLAPLSAPPIEHQTSYGQPPPATVHYEGGGIFAEATPGPADSGAVGESDPSPAAPGHDFGPNMAGPMSPGAPMMVAPPMAAPGMPDIGPPPTHGGVFGATTDRGTLGFTLVAAVGGAAAGGYYGGAWGALAGSLFGGAAVSAYRAMSHVKDGTPDADKEAITSGTYAVGAGVIGGVIWAKLVEPRERMTANKPRRKSRVSRALENPDDCDIRPVGP